MLRLKGEPVAEIDSRQMRSLLEGAFRGMEDTPEMEALRRAVMRVAVPALAGIVNGPGELSLALAGANLIAILFAKGHLTYESSSTPLFEIGEGGLLNIPEAFLRAWDEESNDSPDA